MSQWIPVSERLPDNTMRCLVVRADVVGTIREACWSPSERFFVCPYGGIDGERFAYKGVTHWMPLPDPPDPPPRKLTHKEALELAIKLIGRHITYQPGVVKSFDADMAKLREALE